MHIRSLTDENPCYAARAECAPTKARCTRATQQPPSSLASSSCVSTTIHGVTTGVSGSLSYEPELQNDIEGHGQPDFLYARGFALVGPAKKRQAALALDLSITRTLLTHNGTAEEAPLCEDDDWELPNDEPERVAAGPALLGPQPRSEPLLPSHIPPYEPLRLDPLAMERMDEADPFFRPPTFNIGDLVKFRKWHPAVVLATLLVSWLHLVGHLPFRFCDVVLTVIGYILAEVGQSLLVPQIPSSLAGTLSSLNLEPQFQSLPTCPACLEPHPESVYTDPSACCNQCGTALFTVEGDAEEEDAEGYTGGRRRRKRAWRPHLKTLYKSITEQLGEVLSIPGNDSAMDLWRRVSRVLGKLRDFFDGRCSHFWDMRSSVPIRMPAVLKTTKAFGTVPVLVLTSQVPEIRLGSMLDESRLLDPLRLEPIC
ncbi:hypothetical protein OH76DRAFT_1490895 [Lentinus brumalis]|uniref:Uncharacterized protein n=1 Tax=Lentinus brumalis TaxID=2498619 RepID=A0A371CHE0_9APHY|nr:hypothetical protein OH76DRAFT_1490895 [Polyporus brumalis]